MGIIANLAHGGKQFFQDAIRIDREYYMCYKKYSL